MHPAAHIHRSLNQQSIVCIVHEIGSFVEPGKNDEVAHRLLCGAENHGATLLLEGDHKSFFKNRLESGQTSLSIPTQLVSENMAVDLDDPSASKLITISSVFVKRGLRGGWPSRRSLLAKYSGIFKTLVVRVSDSRGHSPIYNATEISKHVFGDDLTNMASNI